MEEKRDTERRRPPQQQKCNHRLFDVSVAIVDPTEEGSGKS